MHKSWIHAWLLGVLLVTATGLQAQEIVSADAVIGEPFGVGRIEVLLDARRNPADAIPTDRTGRIYYPVSTESSRRVRRLLRELVGAPERLEVYFLFSGNGPLELSLAGAPRAVALRPVAGGARHGAMLGEWWRRYASPDQRKKQPDAYPKLVEDYLLGTLARRLRLPVPEGFLTEEPAETLEHAIRVVMGAESIRSQWVRRVALGREVAGEATQPLPKPVVFPAIAPNVAATVQVEPIALHTPPELFYVRFGSFTNYLWFSHRLEDWGGQVSNLIAKPSIDFGLNDRQQVQLALKQSAMAEIMGPTVISDAALVGTDMFMRDGAAMGILFEARNSLLLASNINSDRSTILKETPEAKEEKVEIAGQTVSLLHTPDNRIRSFYIAQGGYHLVTTSRHIAERFIQVARDGRSLGKTNEFRLARSLYPIDRNDTIFIYLSSDFLQNLLSPSFQVELQRRQRSLAELDVLSVAQVEAAAAGKTLSIGELITAGYLPQSFGKRSDGSRLVETEQGVVDSVRGPRGMFVPVPDVPVRGVTQAEAAAATAAAQKYAASWEQMTPIIAAVARSKAVREGLERVSIDVRMTPLAARQHSTIASFLGSPSKQRLAPIAGDVVAFDAVLTKRQGEGDYHLFGGLRSIDPRLTSGTMMEKLLGMFGGTELVGYIGAWPEPGLLRLLGATANVPVDEAGYSQFITGSWRRIFGQFTVMSFQPELLASVTPQLKFIPAARPAQGWLRADDLRESPLAPSLTAFGYRKAAELSRGNARFLNSLTQQLHVPPADAFAASQSILTANLVCPLGGKYELVDAKDSHSIWRSTALTAARGDDMPPPDYEFPALYWLRGIEGEVRLTSDELAIHADLEMPVKERARPKLELPSFRLPFGNSPAPEKKPEQVEPPRPTSREF